MINRGEFGTKTIVLRKTENGIEAVGDKNVFIGYKIGDEDSRHGVFAEWKYENDCLEFINDEYGFFPVCYYQDDDVFAISTAPLELLELCKVKELDTAAIAVFLRMEMFLGDMTPFKGIKVLPPGISLKYDVNGLSITQDAMAKEGAKSDISLDDAIIKFGELFQKAVDKYKDAGLKKIGLPLSGGRDSRHILFALDKAKLDVDTALTTMAQAPKPDQDAIIAQEVTKELGINHVLFDQPAISLEQELEKNEVTNFMSLHHSWIVPVANHLEENGFDAIYDGICGGTLSAGEFLTKNRYDLYKAGKYEEIVDDVIGDDGYLEKMIGEENYKIFNRELAVKTYAAELEKQKDFRNPIAMFSLWNLSRRSGAASSWMILQRKCHVFAPFLDPEVFEFLTSLPVEYFLDHNFHTKAISKFYPQYAHLPYENKDAPRKKVKTSEAITQSLKLLFYYLKNLGGGAKISFRFVIMRTIKGLLFPSYYNEENSMHYIPIYLTHIEKYLTKDKPE
ncbi:MAG: hypothetical protein JKY84_14165 [Emcibacteraceae bacterium]|nr:hypothetical protein [Emcibacteraceae bacterium]